MKALVLLDKKKLPGGGPTLHPAALREVALDAEPVPPGHVRIKIAAAALNHRDLYIREDLYPAIQFDSVLGCDGSGTVVAAGDAAGAGLVGKDVVVCPTVGWEEDPEKPENILEFGMKGLLPNPGTFAEYITVPVEDAIPKPTSLNHIQAASLPCAGVTAYRAVITCGRVKEGQKVLIPGIGGGVALFALQFAKAAGAEVYVTSSSDEKIKQAVALGAAGGVNYRDANWVSNLRSLSGGFFDLIVDGAAGPNWASYIKLLGPGSTLCVFGAVAGSSSTLTVPFLWFKHVTIKGICMGSRKEFKEMLQFIDAHKIKPVIAKVVDGLEKAEDAFDIMRAGKQFGKLVIDVSKTSGSRSKI